MSSCLQALLDDWLGGLAGETLLFSFGQASPGDNKWAMEGRRRGKKHLNFARFGISSIVAHVCGDPESRYTCRVPLSQQFFMYSSGIVLHAPKRLLSHPSFVNRQGVSHLKLPLGRCRAKGGGSNYTCKCSAALVQLRSRDNLRSDTEAQRWLCNTAVSLSLSLNHSNSEEVSFHERQHGNQSFLRVCQPRFARCFPVGPLFLPRSLLLMVCSVHFLGAR